MYKKIAILTIAVLMAGLLAVPLVMAECYVPGCTHPNCPTCPIPDCPDCLAHQFQCRSQASQGTEQGTGKMFCKMPEYVTVYLYEKNPETWEVIGNGAVAMLKYKPEADKFYFQLMGRKLRPETDYTLIYYPDPWPGNNLICLGSGTSDLEGKLRINGYDCPASPDYSEPQSTGNLPYPPPDDENEGAKLWLVLSADVDCGVKMTNWRPEEYLFEMVWIFFADTDGK